MHACKTNRIRLWATLLCMAILLCSTVLPAVAAPSDDPLAQASAIANGILDAQLAAHGCTDLQQWADTVLPGMVGAGGEWYAIALRGRDPDIDLSTYSEALQRYLRDRDVQQDNATVRQRFALALLASGGGESYIQRTATDSVGQHGHMSLVYGLHLANLGVETQPQAENILTQLLALQCADGGWALQGKDAAQSDVDVTAMTLQALAPHAADVDVAAAIERALLCLSEAQLPTGDFIAYGVSCPESGAQVLVALCALGLDIEDPRFIKEGNTLIDGILRYRTENGCFSHTIDGTENVMATVQCLCAMTTIEMAAAHRGSLYDIPTTPGIDLTDPSVPLPDEGTAVIDLSTLGIKGWICIGAVLLSLLACFVLFLRGKRSWRHHLSVALVCAIAIVAVLLIDVQTPQDYYDGQSVPKQHPVGSVTLTIRYDTVVGMEGTDHLPPDGIILPETSFVIEAGDTVFDILTEAAARYGLRIENTGATATSTALVYITSINDLNEFAYGDLSGWMYFVNGNTPSVGCGGYTLSDGDEIAFRYTRDLGEDIKQ